MLASPLRLKRGARSFAIHSGAVLDLDFVNRRYYWGGEFKREDDFLAFRLGSGTWHATRGLQFVEGNGVAGLANVQLRLGSAPLLSIAVRFFVDAAPSATRNLVEVGDGTANERVTLSHTTTNGNGRVDVVDGGVSQAALTASLTGSTGVVRGLGASWATNSILTSNDGASGSSDTSATLPTTDRVIIGGTTGAPNTPNGSIARVIGMATALDQTALNNLVAAIIA